MQIEFDPDKRDKTLAERGLDFAQAGEVFAGVNVTAEDARFSTNKKDTHFNCLNKQHSLNSRE